LRSPNEPPGMPRFSKRGGADGAVEYKKKRELRKREPKNISTR